MVLAVRCCFDNYWIGIEFDFQANNGRNQALDLNGKNELTFGSGTAVQVAFQMSPRLFNGECELRIFRHVRSLL